jgi:hypothetical protein
MRYIFDDEKWVHGRCTKREECIEWSLIPDKAQLPVPVECGYPRCPDEYR